MITDYSSLVASFKKFHWSRWTFELLKYDFRIKHRKGALHYVPDALSRMFETSEQVLAIDARMTNGMVGEFNKFKKRRISYRM